MKLLLYDHICTEANLRMAIRLTKVGDERLTYDSCQVCRIDLKKLRDRVNFTGNTYVSCYTFRS